MVTAVGTPPEVELARRVPLADLDLDIENPRFGGSLPGERTQRAVLNHIVKTFGVDDVLSSLSVNGFFRAEPLIGRPIGDSQRYVVVEGNRRLAACLILTGEVRAADQRGRTSASDAIWSAHGRPSVDPAWVLQFTGDEEDKSLLTYLGVRHIAGSQPWDSYAKAAWVANVVRDGAFSIRDVAQSVGDQYNTVERLLEGFYFVQQAEQQAGFRPADSNRSGRGSVTAYPFSWVYTILGYTSVRRFLGVEEGRPRPDLVPADRLQNAKLLLDAMFGNKQSGKSSVVSDSRELGELAAAFSRPETVAMIARGLSVSEVKRLSKPVDEQLRDGLNEVRTRQGELISLIAATPPSEAEAAAHLPSAQASRRLAVEIDRSLRAIGFPEPVDE